jgi:flagellar assembly protein FliH
MSSSSTWSGRAFELGLDTEALAALAAKMASMAPQPPAPALPFVPTGEIRSVVFAPFGSAVEQEDVVAEEPVEEIVEVEEAPPPPDYEEIKAEAWRAGFQQGHEEGLRLAADEQREITTRLGTLVQGAAQDAEQLVRSLEAAVVELALAVAEKVVARVAETDRTIVVDVVRAALAEIHDATELRIRVHPEDVALVEPRWQEMLPRAVAQQSELLADELVERGGCVVETRIGYVDGQLKTRLAQVVSTFQAVLDGESA